MDEEEKYSIEKSYMIIDNNLFKWRSNPINILTERQIKQLEIFQTQAESRLAESKYWFDKASGWEKDFLYNFNKK
jgi:hypothetical protein